MKGRMTSHGAGALVTELRNIGDRVVDNARKAMHAAADRIVKEARLNAPVDEHNLENAIHKEVDYDYAGRLQIDVTVGGVVDGVDVDDYAALIHENHSTMKPGEGTLAKRAANPGREIGEKFLERAAEAERDKLEPKMIEVVTEAL